MKLFIPGLVSILLVISSKLIAQADVLPMKGKFIYYTFNEKMENKKHCLKWFSTGVESDGNLSSPPKFTENVMSQATNLNKTSYKLRGIEQTMVMFSPTSNGGSYGMSEKERCIGGNAEWRFTAILPVEKSSLLEGYLLFNLATRKKFKVLSQSITATAKVNWISPNEYSLSFAQFRITYSGLEGNTVRNEEASLEDVYASLQSTGMDNKKMYDNGMETIHELDQIIKELARIYNDELKKAIEFDEL